jgi:ABC-type polysaccharide/polyol phosphate transport system ATPase subunit
MIYVSHDLDSVEKYSDRTMLLHNGEQVMLGDICAVIKKYRGFEDL